MPAVLVPHGHWKNGRVENKPEYSVPALAMNLARQGYVVLTYDMIGYNDTTQLPHDFITPEGSVLVLYAARIYSYGTRSGLWISCYRCRESTGTDCCDGRLRRRHSDISVDGC